MISFPIMAGKTICSFNNKFAQLSLLTDLNTVNSEIERINLLLCSHQVIGSVSLIKTIAPTRTKLFVTARYDGASERFPSVSAIVMAFFCFSFFFFFFFSAGLINVVVSSDNHLEKKSALSISMLKVNLVSPSRRKQNFKG